jgi:DNA-binding NtrC family response regulator
MENTKSKNRNQIPSKKNDIGENNDLQKDSIAAPVDERLRLLAMEYFDPVIARFCQEDIFPLRDLINIFERAVLIKSLSSFNGNQKKTADYLGLKLSTLNEKIKKHNIQFRKEPY